MKERTAVIHDLLQVWDGKVVVPVRLQTMIREPENNDTVVERLQIAARHDLGDVPPALNSFKNLPAEHVLDLARRLG